jgi:hypothetical protein
MMGTPVPPDQQELMAKLALLEIQATTDLQAIRVTREQPGYRDRQVILGLMERLVQVARQGIRDQPVNPAVLGGLELLVIRATQVIKDPLGRRAILALMGSLVELVRLAFQESPEKPAPTEQLEQLEQPEI